MDPGLPRLQMQANGADDQGLREEIRGLREGAGGEGEIDDIMIVWIDINAKEKGIFIILIIN